ncbi:MAG: alpha/beta fold hydrolase, partial [Bdellovibrionota bacterium]
MAYVESLKWQAEIDLIGHSYAGAVALVMSARHPEKIRKVAVCGTMGYPSNFTTSICSVPGIENITYTIAKLAGRW